MSDVYFLPSWKARVCRLAGATFLFLAAFELVVVAVVAVVPGPAFDCVNGPCTWTTRPAILLNDDKRTAVIASPAAERRFDAHVARPIVRAGVAGVMLIESVPFAMLLSGVGLALRRLGGHSGDPFARALPWLRRASLAAIVWAIARPVSASLMAALLSPGTPEGGHWYINFDLNDVGTALMLGVAAYATVWALEAGLKAQRDLAEIV